MKKPAKSAEFQLLRLIEKLSKDSSFLSNNEFISVVNAIKSICSNKQFTQNLIQSFKILKQTKIEHKDDLTTREKQVLLLIGEGLQNNDIANVFKLSRSTIETHRKNIRKKLKLSSNDNLFVLALLFSIQYAHDHANDIF
jgi:DNA-binding NarL/FixJ family response regulator